MRLCVLEKYLRANSFALISFVALTLTSSVRAASLLTFAPVFTQTTNEIAFIETHFDNSTAQKEKLARLEDARATVLDSELRDDQALAALVKSLGVQADYVTTLDESALRARASVLNDYDALALRVGDLPPSPRANRAKNQFSALANDQAALLNAEHAAGISSRLAPFGRRIDTASRLVARAIKLPVPNIRPNAMRARLNGHPFASAGDGAHSSNLFDVTSPGGLYLSVICRLVDGAQVINFTLPVITSEGRYQVAQGLATLTYTPDAFVTNALTVAATNGTFFVQRDRNEVYGLFSCVGPGFELKDGKFRIELPRALRGD